jgi:hypothetical protein
MGVLLAGDGKNLVALKINMVDRMRLRQGAFTTGNERGK